MRKLFGAVILAIATVALNGAAEAAKCNKAAADGIPQLGESTSVALNGGPAVAAGQTFTIDWRRGAMKGRYGVWLMVSFDGPVRFDGKGFYALLPNAEAAFQIAKFQDRTRAVVPYYPKDAANRGTITVVPLQAGPLKVEWAVVGYDGCQEIVAESGSGSATVKVEATGAPEIVVNEFAGGEPKSRIYSPAGGRVIEIYEGRYRLVDEASRAEVAERAGETPRFSPTGRYVAAYAEDGFEIIDAVDGKTVYKDSIGQDLAWDNADSFAAVNGGIWGAVAIIAPSLSDAKVLLGKGSCHACGGTDNTALRIDLENSVAVFNGDQGVGAVSLSSGEALNPDLPWEKIKQARKQVIAFVQRQFQIAPFGLPKRWELHGGLKFSNLRSEAQGQAAGDPLLRFLVGPLTEPAGKAMVGLADGISAVQWRGLSILRDSPDPARNITARLAEFGLPIPEEALDQSAAIFTREAMVVSTDAEGSLNDEEAAQARVIAARIEREVPTSAAALVSERVGIECVPEGDDYDSGKRYADFGSAFRFEHQSRVVWIIHKLCKEGLGGFDYPSLTLFDSSAPTWFLDLETDNPNSDVGTTCYGNIASCSFDARMFGTRLLVLASSNSRAIEVFDIDARKTVFKKYDLPRGDLLEQALVSPDGKLVLQINSDGSFVGYRMADATQLFEGRYVDDEVVVWAPDGRFDATSEGAHYVNLRLPGRVGTYTFDQFSAKLRTPGLVRKLLAGETSQPVSLTSPPSLAGAFAAENGRARGTAKVAADTPVASLLVFQDGLLTDKLDSPAGDAFDLDVSLLPGTRWVSLVALDQAGLASLPMGRDLPPTPGAPRKVHVLAVGVDNYDNPAIPDLGFAVSDARRFAEAVGAIGGDVSVVSSRILDEKSATREGVLAALKELLAAAGPGETVMLFFAGHGVADSAGTYFLATPDTRIDDIAGTALPWEDVAALLREKQARIAVFLDTCQSGAAGTGAFSTNDGAAASLLERIPSGIVIFSASKGREFSEESEAAGGGVFTTALVDVIKGERARFDLNRNGAIEISELYRGVKSAVKANTEGRQTPWIARNQMVGDFSLF